MSSEEFDVSAKRIDLLPASVFDQEQLTTAAELDRLVAQLTGTGAFVAMRYRPRPRRGVAEARHYRPCHGAKRITYTVVRDGAASVLLFWH